ncbi:hypothetical protein M0R45_022875 [Rubus argutus]|uniref:Uncharacterized protein n=1 Tax=Rubus argutus TaxID=59490 RepID=A0AAW1XFW5_RUBAR
MFPEPCWRPICLGPKKEEASGWQGQKIKVFTCWAFTWHQRWKNQRLPELVFSTSGARVLVISSIPKNSAVLLASGPKAEEAKIHPYPHQGSYNIFDFVFCKPDCPCSVPDCVFSGLSLPLPNIKDDSSSSDPVLSGRSLAPCHIKDDYSSYDSDEGTIPADPYAYRPQWDPTQSYLADPPSVVW